MKVAIRVDASRRMGTGHLRRTLALAHALRDIGAQIVFVTRVSDVASLEFIALAGFRALTLPTGRSAAEGPTAHSSWLEASIVEDATWTIEALKREDIDWIVVDHYAIEKTWHRQVRQVLDTRICVIDDLADRDLSCDLVVDHNAAEDTRARYLPHIDGEAHILGGPRYALLAPAFASPPVATMHDEVHSIGVFMGGVDLGNHTLTVMEALERARYHGPVEIVSTRANPNISEVQEAVDRRPATRLLIDLPDLADFFGRHDLQIGAGGGATWERCRLGAATLLLIVAENQRRSTQLLAQWGVAATTSPIGDTSVEAVTKALSPLLSDANLRREMAQRSQTLVDGLGARRVALKMASGALTVRNARMGDAHMVHAWRNAPTTRAVSRGSAPIPIEDHLRWFESSLQDPRRHFFIGHVGAVPVGVVRFDHFDARSVEVSIYLDPTLQGLGLGGELLRAAEEALPPGLDIFAETLEENAASQRLFEAAAYRRLDATRWIKPATGQ
ncbi:MAG: UDP-2,4-diacetamido-2,4,6-trideoxy-beta-L-altropyranose hydrolase [Brevundimonas sp.]|uniref:UDP-2,4-diacetamido-2,4, 6-trideoxy-beta-L-altropyranose hydrolase n=1 Tax=Brevundimonas sp. TaxID=1871086 RepID=UPI004034A9B1